MMNPQSKPSTSNSGDHGSSSSNSSITQTQTQEPFDNAAARAFGGTRPMEHIPALSGWNSINIREQDLATAAEGRRRMAEYMEDLNRRGLTIDEAQAPIQDTWKVTALCENGRRAATGPKHQKVHSASKVAAAVKDAPPETEATTAAVAEPGAPATVADVGAVAEAASGVVADSKLPASSSETSESPSRESPDCCQSGDVVVNKTSEKSS